MNKAELIELFNHYDFNIDNYIGNKMISKGHINTTYIIYFDYGNKVKRYLLQQINTSVFKNPQELMKNIEQVTSFAKNVLKSYGVSNYKNKFVRIYKTSTNNTYVKTSLNNYYRIYHFIEGGVSYDESKSHEILYNAGKTIGYFQNLLAHFDVNNLYETIPFFHDTTYRYQTFLKKLSKANKSLIESAINEISFFNDNKYIANIIMDLINKKQMPLKVTHNDTKLNNIMFDYQTNDGLCLVDLDTIMPGCICFDFGDLIRSSCNLGKEDSTNLDDVIFNIDGFISVAKGYLESVVTTISQIELYNLTNGAIIMSYECGLRFLTDYLDGNHYFKVNYPTHNLIRCKTQIKMCKQIIANKNNLDKKIMDIYYYIKQNE